MVQTHGRAILVGHTLNTLIVSLFVFLIVLLPIQDGIKQTYGEASPVMCVVITNPTTKPLLSNYTVTVNPSSAKIFPGSTTNFDVAVTSKDDIPDTISLGITGLPQGISAVFNPARGTTDFTSKLTIFVDEMICPGVYSPSIIASDTGMQLIDLKLEVAGAGSVYETLRSEIDDLERAIKERQASEFANYVGIVLAAIIGSFLLGAFALFVLLRHLKTKDSNVSLGNDTKLQEIINLLRQLIETSRSKPRHEETKTEGRQERNEKINEKQIGATWYEYCSVCGLRTEHSRDYEGEFCVRCGNR